METWVELVGSPLLDSGRTRLFGHGENPINFVSASDVAASVELAVVEPALRGRTVEVGGPENLTMNELVDSFRTVTGASGDVKHVPRAMLRAMSVVLKPFNAAVGWQSAAALVMDTSDMAFDASERGRSYPSIPMTTLKEAVERDQVTTSA
jgi:NADH dehydrogenase